MKNIGFVIMQIGNKELDDLYNDFIEPTLIEAGFEPKRVDKDNEGELLQPKIIEFITDASIIIADLTNERPNCYLEVGYVMGIGKYRNLILTAREDHYHNSPRYKPEGPRIHFDLTGYDILFWSSDRKKEFAAELLKKIKRRTYVTQSSKVQTADTEWFINNKKNALEGLSKADLSGYMEISSILTGEQHFNQVELRDAARQAPIHTFGWPIGVYLERDEYKPRPVNDGIRAEVITPIQEWGGTYDYWAIRNDASFFSLNSLFEDTRGSHLIFFDTRTNRITEALLYLARLYYQLQIDMGTPVNVIVEHGGLKNRVLKSAGNRFMIGTKTGSEDVVRTEINTTVGELESKLVDHVDTITKSLFINFDYFTVERNIVEDIVTNFVNGKIT